MHTTKTYQKDNIFVEKRRHCQHENDANTLNSNILKHKHDLQNNIENIWNQLKQGIDNIINTNLPSKQSSVTFTNSWVNTTIKKLSRCKKKAYSKSQRSNSEQDWTKYKRLKSLSQKTTRQADDKYLYDIISPKLKDNNKQFHSYIKSRKQDASGISSLRDNQGYQHSEAEIINAQFKSVYTQKDHTHIPHKGPSPYYAMQNIRITENGYINCWETWNLIKPQDLTFVGNYPLQWYTSSSGCSSDCSIT